MASERPGVNGTPAAAIGPQGGIGSRRFAKENVGAVTGERRPALLGGKTIEPAAKRIGGGFGGAGHDAAFEHQARHGKIGMPAFGREGDAHEIASRQAKPRCALHVNEKGLDGAFHEGNRPCPPVEGAGRDRPPFRASVKAAPSVLDGPGQRRIEIASVVITADLAQAIGGGKQGDWESQRRIKPRLHLRLEETGDKAFAGSRFDAKWPEMRFEESTGGGGIDGFAERNSQLALLGQRHAIRSEGFGRRDFVDEPGSRTPKGRESGGMVVVGPSGKVSEGDRHKAGGRKRVDQDAVSPRRPWRPASSSDPTT